MICGTEELDACVFPTYVAVERALDEPGGREMVTFVSGETRGPLVSNDVSSLCAESSYAVQDAPSVCDERAWSSVGDSSQNSCALVNSAHTSGSSTAVFHGLIERVRKTVLGSADDIGWLQRASDLPPVEDGTERFVEILDDIRHGLRSLPKSLVYLLVPGFSGNK